MITTDRDVFVGGHITLEQKEQLREEAARRNMSMSALLAQLIEDYLLVAPDEEVEGVRSNKRNLKLIPKNNEEDVPLPLD